jgi:hypothetical protein
MRLQRGVKLMARAREYAGQSLCPWLGLHSCTRERDPQSALTRAEPQRTHLG